MATLLERNCGESSPSGVWFCPLELYGRRTMIDMFICRHKGDYNEELDVRFDIACAATACDHPSLECDSFVYGDRRYTLTRDSQTSLFVPQGQPILANPKIGCFVLYYITAEAPVEVANSITQFLHRAKVAVDLSQLFHRPSHFGIVTEVSRGEIKVKSKWGELTSMFTRCGM